MPLSPGVYWFLDKNGQVLYVGKAKILKNRLRSYTNFTQLSNRIKLMTSTAIEVKHKVLESELEALLTEAELIRTYQPQFNILLKDDKSPLYIKITDEQFPKVIRLRKKQIVHNTDKKNSKGIILGPFSSAFKTQEVLKIARKIFPWCNKGENQNTPCFYYHLDLCPGSCIGKISQENYNENIKQLILFLKGEKQLVSKNLKKKMNELAVEEKFEEAGVIRDQLEMIEFVTKKSHRLKPELTSPGLKNKISEDGIIYLQKILSEYLALPKQLPLDRIEGFDVSNTQGTNPAVSMVVFTNGESDKSQYRLFNIRSINTPNDFKMMKEAIIRRQNHEEWGIPNLVIIDGGKGQVRSTLQDWKWKTPVIGIAKHPDRLVIPIINWSKWDSQNNSLKNLEYHIVKLDPDHPSLKLIQQIRDESHRFSQFQHKRRRLKGMFE
ncbi:GIY-YIG nuclease family protein [Candidatus Woesebacteria bacterium]|nr:GIY-YIG nuclease family protein [Candidatus Woesebacteria bacterium]